MQVFLADIVVDANDAALNKGEGAFSGVGGYVSANVLSDFVANRFMASSETLANPAVCRILIGEDARAGIPTHFPTGSTLRINIFSASSGEIRTAVGIGATICE